MAGLDPAVPIEGVRSSWRTVPDTLAAAVPTTTWVVGEPVRDDERLGFFRGGTEDKRLRRSLSGMVAGTADADKGVEALDVCGERALAAAPVSS